MKFALSLIVAVAVIASASLAEAGGRFNNQRQRDFNAGFRAGLKARNGNGHCNNGAFNAGFNRGFNAGRFNNGFNGGGNVNRQIGLINFGR